MRRRTKFLLLRVSIIALFTILAGRLWYVQVVNSSYYQAQADISKIRIESVAAPRGVIYDRNGVQLVYNAPSWNISIVPHGIPAAHPYRVYRLLSRLLGGHPPPARIAWLVQQAQWHPYVGTAIKKNVNADTAMVIRQLHPQLPGVRAEASGIRSYVEDPSNSLGQIMGYAGAISPAEFTAASRTYPLEHVTANDQVGKNGIEAQFDAYLHGVNGRQRVEVDAGERPIRTVSPGKTVPGDSVYLTIDWKLQQQVAADLGAALDKAAQSGWNWNRAIAILEDVHTGQILSMVSLPSYNNNWFSPSISAPRYNTLAKNPAHPLISQAYQGSFPPGSIYKIITATAALQTGVADANRTVNDTGQIDLGNGAVFHGWRPGGLGSVNVVGALGMSSDIYFYTVAGGNPTIGPMPSIGPDRLAYWARQFGLGSPTGIELPGEVKGLVPDSAYHKQVYGHPWYIGDSYNSAIGQGDDLTTPLQMVNVAATIANGGTDYRPHIVDRITGRIEPRLTVLKNKQLIQPFVPSPVRRNIATPENISLIQQGMHASVRTFLAGGTSEYVIDPRIDAAGKTGTAEATGPNGTASPDAWWIGYAPYNNPQVAVCVLVPNSNSEGAYAAAPIAHKVLEDYFHLPPLKSNWLDDVQQLLAFGGGGAQ